MLQLRRIRCELSGGVKIQAQATELLHELLARKIHGACQMGIECDHTDTNRLLAERGFHGSWLGLVFGSTCKMRFGVVKRLDGDTR